jgi:hypothetical protein
MAERHQPQRWMGGRHLGQRAAAAARTGRVLQTDQQVTISGMCRNQERNSDDTSARDYAFDWYRWNAGALPSPGRSPAGPAMHDAWPAPARLSQDPDTAFWTKPPHYWMAVVSKSIFAGFPLIKNWRQCAWRLALWTPPEAHELSSLFCSRRISDFDVLWRILQRRNANAL